MPLAIWIALGPAGRAARGEDVSLMWRDSVLRPIDAGPDLHASPTLTLVRQDYEQLEYRQSVVRTPMRLGALSFEHGLGTHSVSHLRIRADDPLTRIQATVGVDCNDNNRGEQGTVEFVVAAAGRELWRSGVLGPAAPAQTLDIPLDAVTELDLHVQDGGDGPAYDHADWADAKVTTRSGRTYWLDDLPMLGEDAGASALPFSFHYNGQPAHPQLQTWPSQTQHDATDSTAERTTTVWDDPRTGLRVTWVMTRYREFAAAEWVLWFENCGGADTPLIDDVLSADFRVQSPRGGARTYQLHRTHGGTPDPLQLAASVEAVDRKVPGRLTAGGRRLEYGGSAVLQSGHRPRFVHCGGGLVGVLEGGSGAGR